MLQSLVHGYCKSFECLLRCCGYAGVQGVPRGEVLLPAVPEGSVAGAQGTLQALVNCILRSNPFSEYTEQLISENHEDTCVSFDVRALEEPS